MLSRIPTWRKLPNSENKDSSYQSNTGLDPGFARPEVSRGLRLEPAASRALEGRLNSLGPFWLWVSLFSTKRKEKSAFPQLPRRCFRGNGGRTGVRPALQPRLAPRLAPRPAPRRPALARATASVSELACIYSAPGLHGEDVTATEGKINALIKAARVNVEPFWPGLFAEPLASVNLRSLICKVGGRRTGPAGEAGGPAHSSAAAPAEEKKAEAKKEESEESDDDTGFFFFFFY
ncbi:LOW QUALITY PROTEIN: uncharacterized protein LOC112406539 [Neophocaena asiaeorientalis asiaeorientalis]|uniref:Large ribosomal subunit protein P1 n=1 Tax=Neophocaena asiaeorientalis asiaeorientalis TaxID=1706337 RepID=A0A341C8N6_NEOAA|nr:LOW QUALITY PROTEIN: uncharacterized protein LOC112406539 [Neophocaena asiaeorientalis asiaeorientalis]